MAISFAKVSRGRSNIILHSIVAPIVTNFGFNIICGSGVALETGTAGLISGPLKGNNLSAGLLANAPAVPMGFILSLLFLALTITFVATIRDSTGFVITTETGGKGTRQGDVAVSAVPCRGFCCGRFGTRCALRWRRAENEPNGAARCNPAASWPKEARMMPGSAELQAVAAFRRLPSQVMRLSRMGSAHPMRLSFLRILLRRVVREGWVFDRPLWQVDAKGVGRAVYRAMGPERTYSLVAFSHDLPDEMRSDRVIATAWDATFALVDGEPTAEDLDRLAANVPLQEAGRVSPKELSLSRANRSVRLFNHVVGRLAEGHQPDLAEVEAVGYLMRTTAVYGAGKFGAADHEAIACRPEMSAPFQAEMLSVWLTRSFTVDLVDHLARTKGGAQATRLDPALCRRLGVGNSTGLGMAPFLVRHPLLLNNWMAAREEALCRVRSQDSCRNGAPEALRAALKLTQDNAASWRSDHPIQIAKLANLRRDLSLMAAWLENWPDAGLHPWNRLWLWGEANLSEEGQEALLALLLEPHGDLVDDLADWLSADETRAQRIDGAMTIGDLRGLLQRHYDWALKIDFYQSSAQARFWYVSEEKLEPRLGQRGEEPGADLEQPLGIGKLARNLHDAIAGLGDGEPIASFLLRQPDHRMMVRRVQLCAWAPYAEVRDNLLDDAVLPIDLMRCKLAFFGASHFDPRSDKWVRISLFQGEPFPEDLSAGSPC